MGWKVRNGRRYFYYSARSGGRVASLYLGAGPRAEQVAAEVADRRAERAAAAAEWRSERLALDAEERAQAGRLRRAEALFGRALEAAGFRRHNRGEWRLRRASGGPEAPGLPPPPEDAELLACAADLAREAEGPALDRLADADANSRVAGRRELDEVRSEMAGPGPSPLARLLAERAALCWLECLAARARAELAQEAGGPSWRPRARGYDRARGRASGRFLRSLWALALLRRLGPTAREDGGS